MKPRAKVNQPPKWIREIWSKNRRRVKQEFVGKKPYTAEEAKKARSA